jgi:hypothetical protein
MAPYLQCPELVHDDPAVRVGILSPAAQVHHVVDEAYDPQRRRHGDPGSGAARLDVGETGPGVFRHDLHERALEGKVEGRADGCHGDDLDPSGALGDVGDGGDLEVGVEVVPVDGDAGDGADGDDTWGMEIEL